MPATPKLSVVFGCGTHRDPGADQDVRGRRHRAVRPHRRRRAGHHRPGRRERRRQVHLHQDPARACSPRPAARLGCSASTRPPTPRRSAPGSATCRSTTACRPTLSAAEFVTHLGRMSGLPAHRRPRARLRGAAPRRAVRGALPADRRLLHRHEAAGQAGPGAGARPRPAAARRADQRPRPGRPGRHAGADPPDRHRVRHLGAWSARTCSARSSGSATRSSRSTAAGCCAPTASRR